MTAQQKSRFRKAYRDTFDADDQNVALKALYEKYSELYGVQIDTLRMIISQDLHKKPAEYAVLRGALAAKQNAKKPRQQRRRGKRAERTDNYSRRPCDDCHRSVPVNEVGELMYHKASDGKWCKDPRPKPARKKPMRRRKLQVTSLVSGGLPGLGKRH